MSDFNIEEKIRHAYQRWEQNGTFDLAVTGNVLQHYWEGRYDSYLECRALAERVKELEYAMSILRDDLLERAGVDKDGRRTVNVSEGIWNNFNDSLGGF